jgi:hypothetical protein
MPYDNPYNRNIANELAQVNHRYAKLYAYSPVDGSGMSGGSNAGVLFQMGNASKRDGEDNMYNDELNLPPQYYYGQNAESMMGGSGFAEGTFRDTGEGFQEGVGGASPVGVYEKGAGMSGGNKEISEASKDLFGSATPQHFRQLGRMLGQHMKGKGMSGGSILQDITEGLGDTLGLVPRLFMGSASPADKEVGVGGAILGNPDPYPRMGDSQRIAGRGKITEAERKALQSVLEKHPEMTGGSFWDDFKKGFNMVVSPVASVVKAVAPAFGAPGVATSAGLSALGYGKRGRGRPKKDELKSANGDLLAMPSPVLANGVPPTAQLRGSYGGAKPSEDKLKESVIKAVEKKMKGKGKKKEEEPVGGANLKGATDKRSEMKGDGRKARAEIVKKVMKDRKVSMIEASKIVKQEGLYKP